LNINLVGHGCMPKCGVSTHCQMTWYEMKINDFNLNFKLNQVHIPSNYSRNMVRVL
jgi:hypothetical protein